MSMLIMCGSCVKWRFSRQESILRSLHLLVFSLFYWPCFLPTHELHLTCGVLAGKSVRVFQLPVNSESVDLWSSYWLIQNLASAVPIFNGFLCWCSILIAFASATLQYCCSHLLCQVGVFPSVGCRYWMEGHLHQENLRTCRFQRSSMVISFSTILM
jgi:hypothetical protein